ncbi:bifunctional diguanylate cyclase/phosphodiesterase [bacterium]|nr:bifunctional diguanylate cyclase/phosphodiesterase [bacterium]MBU1957873.1 bifunctional diguanylate cyclase/phosphodiesterase [bacterium]
MLTAYVALIVAVTYLLHNIESFEMKLKDLLLNQSIDMIDTTSTKIIDRMLIKDPNFVHSNLQDSEVRLKNEKKLSVLVNDDITALYMLFVAQNKLFFLLDTGAVDRGEIGEVFIPENEAYFEEVYKDKKKRTFIQKELGHLGFTLIKPIIQNNQTVGYLVVDYTQKHLSSLSAHIDTIVEVLVVFIFVLMFLLSAYIIYFWYSNYVKYKIYRNPKTNTLNKVYLIDNVDKIDFKHYYVALADLDFFKRVNNLYGQANGDKVIISIIQSIASQLRKEDMLIQYSGEEFLLLISKDKMNERMFQHLLEDIRILIERLNFNIADERFSLTISIGALMNTELEKSLQDCIHKADTALYECKHNGRNTICYFDMTQTKRVYREKLKELIESDKLVCYYQPIRNLTTRKLHHYEALLRIEDGENIIFPDKILPDLEDSHLYSFLTKRVLEYNIKTLRFDPKMRISVNLSADDLVNDTILSLLAQNADLSERMFIEILENKSIDYKKVELSIQKLKLFGYKICIDDFGTGYSNLNHLLNLSVDYLKIDGSIIKEIHHDRRAYSIVKTFALFCRQNDIEVIAEFIDNQDIVDILKSFGVQYGQGFYFSKAKPYAELDKEHL